MIHSCKSYYLIQLHTTQYLQCIDYYYRKKYLFFSNKLFKKDFVIKGEFYLLNLKIFEVPIPQNKKKK